MATIEIDDKVYEGLADRARANNRTVEAQAEIELRRDHLGRTREEYLRDLDRMAKLPPIVLPPGAPDPVDLIREDRDSR